MEDTIYYLSESLRKEAIDLEVFLKVMLHRVIGHTCKGYGIVTSCVTCSI